jgi:hypothetical protein
MKRTRVLLTFMSMTDGALVVFARGIVAAFKNNPYFPDPNPGIIVLENEFQNYALAVDEAKLGGVVAKAKKNEVKIVLQQLLLTLSDYVNYHAQNNRAAFLSSMFHISKEVYTAFVLSAITNVIFKNGMNAGSIMMIVKDKNKGAVSYSYEYTIDDPEAGNAKWVSKGCKAKRCTLNNLPRGVKVWLRVGVTGSRKQSFYNNPVMKYIQ